MKSKLRWFSWKKDEHRRYFHSVRVWLKYQSDNIFAAGPVVIIAILALISVCLILIFSSLYFWNERTESYSQALWETFMRTMGDKRLLLSKNDCLR